MSMSMSKMGVAPLPNSMAVPRCQEAEYAVTKNRFTLARSRGPVMDFTRA
jgi:hypothetical protein